MAMIGASMKSGSSMFDGDVALEVSWLLASIPGLAAVGMLKGKIARDFAVQFGRRWAMFGWWGAAEIEHPFPYPQNYEAAATSWSLHQVADELDHAPDASPTLRERARREYIRSLTVIQGLRGQIAQPPTIYRSASAPPMLSTPRRLDDPAPGPFPPGNGGVASPGEARRE